MEKPTIDKNDKNRILQQDPDMNFGVSVSTCGVIEDTYASKLDIKYIYIDAAMTIPLLGLSAQYTHINHTPNSRCAICSGFEDKNKMSAHTMVVEALARLISRLIVLRHEAWRSRQAPLRLELAHTEQNKQKKKTT
jgi:hypothetical protein